MEGELMPLPAGAILAWDTRLWTEGDPTLENLGSAGATYDMPITPVPGEFDNYVGTQVNDYYGWISTDPTPGTGIDWADFGGTLGVGGPFTFIFATGDTADGAGHGEFNFVSSGEGFHASVSNYDGTIDGPSTFAIHTDPANASGDPGLSDSYDTVSSATDNTVYFIEVDMTGTPYIEIRQGETLVSSDTHTAYAPGFIDGIHDPGSGVNFFIVGAETDWSSVAWRMRGMAMVRGVLDTADREEWIEYFFPAEVSCDDPLRFPLFDDFGICVEVMWDGATWTSVTEDLRAMTIRLPSRSRLQAVYQSGSASLTLDNRLRTYDPLYAAGPHFGDLKANRRMRVGFAESGEAVTFIFTGWTDGWSFAYDKSNNDSTATITCIDALAKAGFSAIPAGTTPTLSAGEYVATRGDALVTAAGSTDITYSAGSGYARFGTTWDATVQHNLLTELRRCAELEVAPLLALDDGTLHQEARYWFATRALSATSNCTIPSATLPCTEVRVLYDARELVSAVSMTDEVGNVATATNAAAVTEFGERYADLNFNNMPAGDASSLAGAAATWVGLRGGEEMRFDTVTILPQRSDYWWEHIQNRRPLDRITVSITPMSVGDPITQDAFIDGIEHHITVDSWVTTWHLLPADLYAAVDFFILGTDVLDGAKVLGY
jgi:hypothetical protein